MWAEGPEGGGGAAWVRRARVHGDALSGWGFNETANENDKNLS